MVLGKFKNLVGIIFRKATTTTTSGLISFRKLYSSSVLVFRQLGRASLRPIFDQSTRRDGRMNDELREALRWWIRVLATHITQLHEWTEVGDVPVHLFTDASSGNGGYLGVVLFADGQVWWTHRDIPDRLRAAFCNRKDN